MSAARTFRAAGPAELFPAAQVFADTDGDGLPDRLGLFLAVDRRLTHPAVWAAAANLAMRLAAEVAAFDPPIVRSPGRLPAGACLLAIQAPDSRDPSPARIEREGALRLRLRGSSPPAMAELLQAIACGAGGRVPPEGWRRLELAPGPVSFAVFRDRRGRPIARRRLPRPAPGGDGAADPPGAPPDLLSPQEAIYRPVAGDPRGRRLVLAIAIEDRPVPAVLGLALCEAAAELALEATEVELPRVFVGEAPPAAAVLRIAPDAAAASRLEAEAGEGGCVLRLAGGPRPLSRLLRIFAARAAAPEGGLSRGRFDARLEEIRELLGGRGPRGPWARALVAAAVGEGALPSAASRERKPLEQAAAALGLPAPPPAASRRILQRERIRAETEDHLEALAGVPPGSGEVEGVLWVGRPRAARRALLRRAERLLRARGYRPRLRVLHAYKPGLCWLLEEILPRLKRLQGIGRVEIAFRPFHAASGLEMETRFLQEIYPAPDRLAAELGLPCGAVVPRRRESLPEAYRVRAFDRRGRLLFEEALTPRLARLPAFPGGPEEGFVHPATGGVRLLRGGRVLLDREIPTDRERFWGIVQQRFWPALEAEMAGRLEGGGGAAGVFWEEVRIEAAIAEEERRIGVGEERIAPLEALHEDLYFGLLDAHRAFCRRRGLEGVLHFGRIVPRIRRLARGGTPRALLAAIPAPPRPAEAAGPAPAVRGLILERRRLEVLVCGDGLEGARPAAWARLGAAWGLALRAAPGGRGVLWTTRAPRPEGPPRPKPPAARPARPRLDRRVALAAIAARVKELGRLAGVHAFQAGRSLEGRPIWALEIACPAGGALASHARRRLLRPTLLVNARHHANEVAGTQAALRLAWELAATDPGRRLLRRVNAVVIPLENPDGVALLETLLPEAPGHKLHAARYNAAGVEWYADYFAAAPRFPEARPKAGLWQAWLPLWVLDAHGVPSHEWDQPFAGNAPGPFRAYWIPRAFVYAILPFLDTPGHPGHRWARRIGRLLGRALRGDPRIAAREAEFRDRYLRYARRWEPEFFPAPAPAGGLTLCATEGRLAGLNFAARRFPVTVAEVVTEVTDEVVRGRLLEDCGRAHLLAARALLAGLARLAGGRLERRRLAGGGVRLAWRSRQAGAAGGEK